MRKAGQYFHISSIDLEGTEPLASMYIIIANFFCKYKRYFYLIFFLNLLIINIMSIIFKKMEGGLPLAIQELENSSNYSDKIKNAFDQITDLEEYILGLKLEVVLASLDFIYENYSDKIESIDFGARELGLYEDYYALTLKVMPKDHNTSISLFEKIIFETIPQDDQIINFLYNLECVSFNEDSNDLFKKKMKNEINSKDNYQETKNNLKILIQYNDLNDNNKKLKNIKKPRL